MRALIIFVQTVCFIKRGNHGMNNAVRCCGLDGGCLSRGIGLRMGKDKRNGVVSEKKPGNRSYLCGSQVSLHTHLGQVHTCPFAPLERLYPVFQQTALSQNQGRDGWQKRVAAVGQCRPCGNRVYPTYRAESRARGNERPANGVDRDASQDGALTMKFDPGRASTQPRCLSAVEVYGWAREHPCV
jgi:hypothetical protein